ncbi:MAG TPA: HNH endonuclease signature motif containing protein [Microthrixaceae bacterium]|nr:HNH endonuclease signature motif containing protein [Microthrixaceae bacterium]
MAWSSARSGYCPSLAQQRADALADLAGSGGGAVTTEVVLHVGGDGCTLDDGTPISGSIVERLVPESFISAVIHDADSRPINASGRQRHPTRRQRRVVKERDRTCVDCDGSVLLQYDHVPDYDLSNRTLIDELELRCAPCHQRRHL